MMTKEDLEAKISSVGSRLAVLRHLVESPGWEIYSKLLQDQENLRKGEILLRPLESFSKIPAQEFAKGEVMGLNLAIVMPFTQIEVLTSELQALRLELERENALAKAREDGGSRSRVDGGDWYGGEPELEPSDRGAG